jgi:hypothetical protein
MAGDVLAERGSPVPRTRFSRGAGPEAKYTGPSYYASQLSLGMAEHERFLAVRVKLKAIAESP